MSTLSLAAEFQMLRVHLEPALLMPSIVVVSSARGGDGKHLAARGLAASFEAVGARTLLVHSDAAGSKIAGAVEPQSLREAVASGIEHFTFKTFEGGPDCIILSGDELRRSASRDSLMTLCSSIRSQYRYAVVDAATFLDDNLALLFTAAADGVLLTIREGRRVTAEDRELVNTLDRVDAKLLGIIAVSSATVRADTAATLHQRAYHVKYNGGTGHLENGRKQSTRQPV